MEFILIYFLFSNGKIFISVPLRILALSNAFNFTLGTSAIICESDKGGARGVSLVQPIEWKGVCPLI